ncbi:MAG: DUF4134 domain-containing protein [Olivibacter sp.]|nr:DUF4134 domain-containing protein [Olivibacter sp. UJ_SKK_5.1]
MRKITLNKFSKKTTVAFAVAFLFSIAGAYAQGDFSQGLAQGTSEIITYLDPITSLIMAIGGVVGIVGGVRIYQKWNNGDQDINKELMSWGGSAIFLIIAPIVIRAVFGV